MGKLAQVIKPKSQCTQKNYYSNGRLDHYQVKALKSNSNCDLDLMLVFVPTLFYHEDGRTTEVEFNGGHVRNNWYVILSERILLFVEYYGIPKLNFSLCLKLCHTNF